MVTERTIVKFWIPLSSTWLMMAAEGPILAAVVARLPDAVQNLAAYGVAAAVAMLVESPVIGLLSAVIALASSEQAVRLLRTFMRRLYLGVSVLMVVVCMPFVFTPIARNVIGLSPEVAWRMHVGLLCMICWPAAIGIRRFYQGLLIRRGLTRTVAYGTVVRLTTMATSALLLAALGVEGVIVGCAGLTIGVSFEAIAIWWLSHRSGSADEFPLELEPLTNSKIYRFYLPLAATSIVSFLAVPLLSAFIVQLPNPVKSLAVLPVVNSFLFVFRSFGFSYQEVGIAFLGKDIKTYSAVKRVGKRISVLTTIGMVVVVLTPLLEILYQNVFALSMPLVDLAIVPTRLLIVVPITAAAYSLQRAVMITAHRTIHVTVSMLIEVGSMAILMVLFIVAYPIDGILAAAIATSAGMVLSTLYAHRLSSNVRRGWVAS